VTGINKPINLGLEFNEIDPGMGRGAGAGFHASIVLSRRAFGIDVNLPLETGGVVLGDKVIVTLEIEALKSA
jgi:polyisoprenoid-binding protein YceI